jgi:hypothetical protein
MMKRVKNWDTLCGKVTSANGRLPLYQVFRENAAQGVMCEDILSFISGGTQALNKGHSKS